MRVISLKIFDKNLKFLAGGIISAFFLQGAAFAHGPEIESGLQHMKAGNYGLAARLFHKAARKNPNDAIARYHLANSFVYLKRHEDAMTEYRRSYMLDPYSVVSGYCRKALLAYQSALPVPAVTKAKGKASIAAAKTTQAPPVNVRSDRENDAVAMIRRQAAIEKVRHHDYASSLSENAIKAGDVRIKRIRDAAEEEIDLLYRYGPMLPAGSIMKRVGRPYNTLTPYEQKMVDNQVAQIRRKADQDIKDEQSSAEEHSSKIKRWSEERKESLDSVADNLESQLTAKSSPSGIKLAPEGTGLYVRNYQLTKKKRNIPDARYSMARFVDRLDQDPDLVEMEDLGEMESKPKVREEEVRGKVVNIFTRGS